MTYQEYKDGRQAEFNALPIFFAFSNLQFERELNKRGLTIDDAAEYVYRFGDCGGFYLKKDADVIREFFDKPDPITELIKNPDFAYEAFYCEMGNHEYHINYYQGNWDVLSCFGNIEYNEEDDFNDYFTQLNFTKETRNAYRKARRQFLRDAIEKGWY